MKDQFAGRVTDLNDAPVRDGAYVLYWMQQAQRARCNHALEYAVRLSNERRLPVVAGFGLTADYPQANLRHYQFMVEGLVQTAEDLRARGIRFVLRLGDPPGVALDLGRAAAAIICDRGYLRHQREWRYQVARTAACRVIEVESELVVPVESASLKQEYAARTIRPRIHRRLGEYLIPLPETPVDFRSVSQDGRSGRGAGAGRTSSSRTAAEALPKGEEVSSADRILARLPVARDPGAVSNFFAGGASEALGRLSRFRQESLASYETERSEPGANVSSNLSPYLHFGQISSLEVALALDAPAFVDGLAAGQGRMKIQPGSVGMRVDDDREASSRDAFLEELLVRRGLAHNYVWYSPDYDRYDGLPQWAQRTLAEHAADDRPVLYTPEQLVACETHDEYWNTAMTEMITTGYMHNYMRMYWAKKILEWSPDPRDGFSTVLELNNRYFLDGRDPNSFANVAWTFGLHDRPWTERPIFGKVRYMNANGLKRKFDMAGYAEKVQRLVSRAGR